MQLRIAMWMPSKKHEERLQGRDADDSCDEPSFCAMCGCGNRLALCTDLPS